MPGEPRELPSDSESYRGLLSSDPGSCVRDLLPLETGSCTGHH